MGIQKVRKNLRFLLLQYRTNADVKLEEAESFCRFAKIATKQLKVLNLFDRPTFPLNELLLYDGVFLGGTSETSVFKDSQLLKTSKNAVKFLIEKKHPTFASCFGFQIAIAAFDGEIIHQEEDFEMGTYKIFQQKEAKTDVLLSQIPNPFYGVSVHKQKVEKLPKQFLGLARTKDCWHVVKATDAPFWGFQFHPEVDHNVLSERLTRYCHLYTRDAAHLAEILSQVHPTDYANSLCELFVDKVVLASNDKR